MAPGAFSGVGVCVAKPSHGALSGSGFEPSKPGAALLEPGFEVLGLVSFSFLRSPLVFFGLLGSLGQQLFHQCARNVKSQGFAVFSARGSTDKKK